MSVSLPRKAAPLCEFPGEKDCPRDAIFMVSRREDMTRGRFAREQLFCLEHFVAYAEVMKESEGWSEWKDPPAIATNRDEVQLRVDEDSGKVTSYRIRELMTA